VHPRKKFFSAAQTPRGLLTTNLGLLHTVAEKLLEKEVLDGAEINVMVRAFGCNGGDPFTPLSAAALLT
jgi:hypothetical protein